MPLLLLARKTPTPLRVSIKFFYLFHKLQRSSTLLSYIYVSFNIGIIFKVFIQLYIEIYIYVYIDVIYILSYPNQMSAL